MNAYNLTSLFPYSVGFDRFDKMFDAATRAAGRDASYPPYNIVKVGEDRYRITMALAGFTDDDLEIVAQENVLVVRGRVKEPQEQVAYLHRGIGTRAFEHSFQLADFVKVTGAQLRNGLLDIELVREVPEAKKPHKIVIKSNGQSKPKAIDDQSSHQAA